MIADKATCTLEKKAKRKERKKNNGEEEEESIRHEYANIESIRECFAVLKKTKVILWLEEQNLEQHISYPRGSVDDPAVFIAENMMRRSFVTCTEQKTKIIVSVGFSVKLRTKRGGSRQNLAPTFVKTVKERPVLARQVLQARKGARALQRTRLT